MPARGAASLYVRMTRIYGTALENPREDARIDLLQAGRPDLVDEGVSPRLGVRSRRATP